MSSSSHHVAWPLAMRLAAIWLVYVTWSSCAGWTLSWLGALHLTGYLLAFPVLLLAITLVWRRSSDSSPSPSIRHPWWRSPACLAWLAVMALCLAGGLMHPPSNYDALSYRLPRILFWWQEHEWHWLGGTDRRMNYSGVCFEWQMLPIITLFRSDRLLFLLNWLPSLLLPFLAFPALRFLGTSARTAACWMWPISLAYGLVLQSSSIGNDMQGAIFVMATLAFFRLAESRSSLLALVFAGLSAAALSSLKGSNLPLMLPLGLAGMLLLWRRPALLRPLPLATAAVPILLASFLPTAILNHQHAGTWTGDSTNEARLQITRPVPGLTGNAFNLVVGVLQPPVLPGVKPIKKILSPLDAEDGLGGFIRTGFPRFKLDIGGEVPSEEFSGTGLAITLLAFLHCLGRRTTALGSLPFAWSMAVATAIAMLAYMAKMGSENTARIMLPYAPLAIGCFLALMPRRGRMPRTFAYLPALFLLPALLLNPNRPLIPLDSLSALPGLPRSISERLEKIHQGYSDRNDPLAPLRMRLPHDCREIGYAGGPARSSYSLFKPFGTRRIIEVSEDNATSFDWIIASPIGIETRLNTSWDAWLEASSYEIHDQRQIVFYTRAGPEEWFLLRKR